MFLQLLIPGQWLANRPGNIAPLVTRVFQGLAARIARLSNLPTPGEVGCLAVSVTFGIRISVIQFHRLLYPDQ
jgi:hypothetical protein